ncbi:hypothetical protein B0H13DRAFT_1932242 [Mycena leptocephala]|nr:hypothetical protein B0H13DRAFT_1932242 [Mycena leptocephala]
MCLVILISGARKFSSRTSRRAPVREEAAPPPLPPSIPRKRGKAMSDEPEIAVLERGSISGSDDVPLSVLQSAKGKGKSKADTAPASSSKKTPVLSDDGESERASSERAGSAGEGLEDEGENTSGIVMRKVKVKRGKRLVNVEMTGPRNTYDSAEWHQANDLFIFDAPLTSTGGNKIVTHAYPYDEKHPHFSKTWKRQVTLASLPTRSFFTRSKGCVWCLVAESDCVRLRYGDDAPMGACMHCRADNFTCEASPVEFDWEVTDGALPDINTEFLELQLTLMLEIAKQVGGTRTTERLLTRFMHHLRIMGTNEDVLQTQEEGDDRTDNSETEVEVRKGNESGDVSMDGARQTKAPSHIERERFGRVVAHARSSDSSEDGRRRDSIAGRTSFGSASGPSVLVSLLVAGFYVHASQAPFSAPNPMRRASEGGVGGGNELEEGEVDAEGEIVVGTPVGETLGAGGDVNMN